MPQVLSSQPLVIAAIVESDHDVDVTRAALTAEHDGVRFIGVVAVDDEAQLGRILGGFRTHLAEVIFTWAGVERRDLAAAEAARLALERHGMGQDFVFTVPALSDALTYAVERVTTSRVDRCEGTEILVVGSPHVVDTARNIFLRGT